MFLGFQDFQPSFPKAAPEKSLSDLYLGRAALTARQSQNEGGAMTLVGLDSQRALMRFGD